MRRLLVVGFVRTSFCGTTSGQYQEFGLNVRRFSKSQIWKHRTCIRKVLLPRPSGTASINNWSLVRTVSQASHVSPSLGVLLTLLRPSCGRGRFSSLRRMTRRRTSWSSIRREYEPSVTQAREIIRDFRNLAFGTHRQVTDGPTRGPYETPRQATEQSPESIQ